MTYYFMHSDLDYLNNVKSFYEKYYRSKLEVIFNGIPSNKGIVIMEKNTFKAYENYLVLTLCSINNQEQHQISKYQNYHEFFSLLLKYVHIETVDLMKEDFLFCSIKPGVGSTVISLNCAKMLSKNYKTFWLSLDTSKHNQYYLNQSSQYSLSDVLFYLKQESMETLNLETTETFDYCNIHDYLEDIVFFSSDDLLTLITFLKKMGYEKIVIDVGTRYELIKVLTSVDYYLVTDYNSDNYAMIQDVVSFFDHEPEVIINKRKLDFIMADQHLISLQKYHYVDHDYDFEKGSYKWYSEKMVAQLEKILRNI